MPLYDVTNGVVYVKPQDAESYELLVRARTDLGAIRFSKDCRIIDIELQKAIDIGQAKNKLVFTRAGFITGHSSTAPHKDVQHIWDSAEMVYPCQMTLNRTNQVAAETQLKFIGGLVRWRISLLDDIWLAYRRPSGKFNQHTGKEITISEYWINNDFIYIPKPKKRGFTVDELKGKQW